MPRSKNRLARRVGIFGGSFDPPHVCHVFACAFALGCDEIDEVWVVPSYRHPFGKAMAPFGDRVRMVRLAMRPLGARVKVSTMERDNEGPGYTFETVRRLGREHPDVAFRLVVGSDILDERRRWHRFAELTRMAPLLVVPREARGARSSGLQIPDVSSSQIRELLRRHRAPGPMLPALVYRYVCDNDLYGAVRHQSSDAPCKKPR